MVPLIRSDILDGAMLESLRGSFRAGGIPCVNIENAVDTQAASHMRARVEAAGYEVFYIADRGRYQCNESLEMDSLFPDLLAVASRIADAPLSISRKRWLCFRRGDYSLVKDDARNRLVGTWFDLTLDISETVSDQSQICYSDGATVSLIVPQEPGCLTLVERAPGIYRYIRPMTLHSAAERVHRLQLLLQRA